MTNLQNTLAKIGLSDKEIKIYLALLKTGPTAIRKVADTSGVNRGTTYELLKKLQSFGLVSYFHKGKRQHFVAEDPKVIADIISRKKLEIEEAESNIEKVLTELSLLSYVSKDQPVIKFYENYSGIRTILEDVLSSASHLNKKEYIAYSSSSIRPYLYHPNAFPDFTAKRIKKKIHVRTIAIGAGGKLHGEDERKWLTKKQGAPTYTLLYAGKIAMISVSKKNIPHGLIIEDEAIYETELMIFNSLWNSL
ncbi:TrmB family transcriptional regulator [Candidatus Nomurabacteria bacterium]|nr:TrmB family transcriptional regulator [Candidatus Nomurabacteria bacterium]